MRARWLALLSTLILAAAQCGGRARSAASETETPTAILLPRAWTATPLPSPPARTPTARPTATATATRIPIGAPARIPNLPTWASNPRTPMLLWKTGGHAYDERIALVDASTSRLFELPLSGVSQFLWLDDTHIGFFSEAPRPPEAELTVLDLSNGRLSIETLVGETVWLVDVWEAAPDAGGASWHDAVRLRMLQAAQGARLSHDGLYLELASGLTGELWALDLAVGEPIPLSSASDGYYGRGTAWSPAAPLLAELQENSDPNVDDPVPDRIAVYDASSGRRVAMTNVQVQRGLRFEEPLPGNLAYFNWSPDGTRLLFIKHTPGNPPTGTLCTFELSGGRTECMPEAGKFVVGGTANHIAWSADGRQIRYLTCDVARGESALLTFDLEQATLSTLSGDELDLGGRLIAYFEPSPEDAYLLITHDTTCGRAGTFQDPAVILYDREDGSQLPLPFDAAALPAGKLVWRPSR